MADNVLSTRIEFDATQAIATLDKVKSSLRDAGQATEENTTTTRASTEAQDKHNKSTSAFTGLIKEERSEMRMRNFALREGAGTVGMLSEAMGGSSGLGKAVQGSVGSLFEMDFALKGVAAATEKMGGSAASMGSMIGGAAIPISVAIGALILMKKALDDDNETWETLKRKIEENQRVLLGLKGIKLDGFDEINRKLQEQIQALSMSSADWISFGLMVAVTGGDISKAFTVQDAVTRAHIKLLNEVAAQEREILGLTEARATKDESATQHVNNEKTKLQATLMSGNARLVAEEGLDFKLLEMQRAAALRQAKTDGEITAIVHLYEEKKAGIKAEYANKYKADADSIKEKEKQTAQELYTLTSQTTLLKIDNELKLVNSHEKDQIKIVQNEKIAAFQRLDIEEKLQQAKAKNSHDAVAIHAKFLEQRAGIEQSAGIKIENINTKNEETRIKNLEAAENSMSAFKEIMVDSQKARELEHLNQWQAKENAILEKAKLTGDLQYNDKKKALDASYQKQKSEIDRKFAVKNMLDTMDVMKSGLSAIQGLFNTSSNNRIQTIETERDAKVKQIDTEMAAVDRSTADGAAKYDSLAKQKLAIEDDANAKISAEKKKQWETDKQIRIINSIMDMASAIAKANPIIPLMILAGVVGAAQTAAIAGQNAPKFARGTPNQGFTVPSGFENDTYPIMAASGETVRVTPAGKSSSAGSLMLNINMTPGVYVDGKKFVKDMLESLRRETGMTIDELTQNQKASLTL